MRPVLSMYIGGSSTFGEIERIKKNTVAIQSLGGIVTSTWWQHVESAGGANGADLTVQDQFAYSYSDLLEVDAANWLWVNMPPLGLVSAGAFLEFGYALKGGKKILVSGPGQHASIFTAQAHIRCATDNEAIEFFRKIV